MRSVVLIKYNENSNNLFVLNFNTLICVAYECVDNRLTIFFW